jgi:Uma2 family endonuclease
MGVSLTIEKKKTVQDYKQLPEGAPYQLINGELIMSPAPKRNHQKLIGRIHALILAHCDKTLIGEVYIAPSDVYLDNENVVQPDIFFVSKINLSILTEYGAEGVPDMIVELLSPSNAYYDLRAKLQLYEKYGVKEYFIVDPEDNMVIAYSLANSRYKEVYREPKKIESEVLGTTITW